MNLPISNDFSGIFRNISNLGSYAIQGKREPFLLLKRILPQLVPSGSGFSKAERIEICPISLKVKPKKSSLAAGGRKTFLIARRAIQKGFSIISS